MCGSMSCIRWKIWLSMCLLPEAALMCVIYFQEKYCRLRSAGPLDNGGTASVYHRAEPLAAQWLVTKMTYIPDQSVHVWMQCLLCWKGIVELSRISLHVLTQWGQQRVSIRLHSPHRKVLTYYTGEVDCGSCSYLANKAKGGKYRDSFHKAQEWSTVH